MLKTRKETKEVNVEDFYCDICHEKMYIHKVTTLSVDDEDNYNYGDSWRFMSYNYDICEKCIKNILFPYIREVAKCEPRVYLDEE